MPSSFEEKRNPSFYFRRVSGLLLLLAVAAVFLFSGVTKLLAFEQFVWNIMDAGISSMMFASVLARLLIGLELMLGLFLLAHIYLKSFTYPAVIALLAVFIVYLILLILKQGDQGNCGCFGDSYVMRPSMAILKNVLLIAVTFGLYKLYPIGVYKNTPLVAGVIGMASIVVPFVAFPLSQNSEPTVVSRPLDLSPLYHSSNPENIPPTVELRKGKHIIAFMSLTCPHCKKAAFLLQVIHRQHPDIPMFFVLNGDPDQESAFFEETHARQVPHILFRGSEFVVMAGNGVPAIYWVNNSIIEREANYFQLDPKYMEEWLNDR